MLDYKFSTAFKVWYTIISSIIALLLPIILYYVAGSKPSLSQYVDDSIGNIIFSCTLILIAHSLTIRKLFTFPAVMLLFIVGFDCNNFETIHNISATLFFLSMGIIMCLRKELCIYGILMFLNIPTLLYIGLYWFEIIEISFIIFYNFHVLYLLRSRIINNF